MESTFSVATSITNISKVITDNMEIVANKAVALIGDAAPYIIGIVAVGIVLSFGISLIRKFRTGA